MTLEIGVGGPGFTKLNHFGGFIKDAYGETPYLVGSAAVGKTWRDVDVRLMLPDARFDAMFGTFRPFGLGAMWCLLTASISALGTDMTGLPVDFQFQPVSHANERYKGVRHPLGTWLPWPAREEAP